MESKRADAEQSFRSSLNDVVAVAKKLVAHCRTVEEMIGVCELALENDAQLKLLILVVSK